MPEKLQECFALLVDSILALQRENKEILWGSMVKETMKRKKPSFDETYYGFRTFSHLLEDAQRRGILTLRRDQRSGSYVVDDLAATGSAPIQVAAVAPATAEPAEASNGSSRSPRRRRGRRRGRSSTGATGTEAAHAGSVEADEDGEGDDVEDLDDGPELEEGSEHGTEHVPTTVPTTSHSHAATAARRSNPRARPCFPPKEERSHFSLFSWIRRDSTDKPSDKPE